MTPRQCVFSQALQRGPVNGGHLDMVRMVGMVAVGGWIRESDCIGLCLQSS